MAEATLIVKFHNIDWPFLQSVYGWAALQYQAWARGHLTIAANFTQSLIFYADNALELWIDDDHYFGGDYYAYRRAPLVLHLDPGSHMVNIRLIRDVRVMGGIEEPETLIKLKAESSNGRLVLVGQKIIIPDLVNGFLASPFALVPVRNEGRNAIDILDIATNAVCPLVGPIVHFADDISREPLALPWLEVHHLNWHQAKQGHCLSISLRRGTRLYRCLLKSPTSRVTLLPVSVALQF